MLHALPIIPGPVAWAWHKAVMSHSAPETPALQQWVEKASPGQVCDHKSWKPSRAATAPGTAEPQAQLTAEHRCKALCLPSTPVFPGGLGLSPGSNGRGCSQVRGHPCALRDAVPGKQKGLTAPSTRDCAAEE